MEKRNITFVAGDFVFYRLSIGKLSQLIFFYPKDYCKVSETVYQVESLDLLTKEYDTLPSPEDSENVLEICFFEGDYFSAPLSDYQLGFKLDRIKRQFSCAEIAKDTYKVIEL